MEDTIFKVRCKPWTLLRPGMRDKFQVYFEAHSLTLYFPLKYTADAYKTHSV